MLKYEDIISFESLYKAHRVSRLGKRHKKEVILFETNLSENLWKIHYDLKYKKYKISDYHKFIIYDPKEREIQAISYRDRIVQHSLCDNYLTPLFERHLIYDNTACRKNKGSSFAIARLRKFMLAHYKKYGARGYFVKIDVRKYFDSIDHNILKTKLNKIIKDQDILGLVYQIIDSYNFATHKGLPMGNQTSQCFALFYLDCLDRYFKENLKIKYYVRYMDDIIILTDNKKIATQCLVVANNILKNNNLCINPKSQIISAKNGVEFLGWRFFYTSSGHIVQKLRHSTKKRIKQKAKTIRYLAQCHRINSQHPQNSLVSYKGFLGRGDSYHFLSELQTILV